RRRGDGNAAEGNAGRSDRRGSLLSNHRDVIGISATASRHASLTDMKKRASWLDSDRSLETDCPAGAGRNRQGIERVRVTRTVLTEIDGCGRAVEVVKNHLGRECGGHRDQSDVWRWGRIRAGTGARRTGWLAGAVP